MKVSHRLATIISMRVCTVKYVTVLLLATKSFEKRIMFAAIFRRKPWLWRQLRCSYVCSLCRLPVMFRHSIGHLVCLCFRNFGCFPPVPQVHQLLNNWNEPQKANFIRHVTREYEVSRSTSVVLCCTNISYSSCELLRLTFACPISISVEAAAAVSLTDRHTGVVRFG